MSSIFISYRRQDAAAYAGRLQSDLAQRYGRESVFFDLADLSPGMDWSSHLHKAVSSSEVILVVIGPQWLTATDARGERRIDDPADFIRSEIATALRLRKRVVPVLVGDAMMPMADQLPEDVSDIARWNALRLSDTHWAEGLERLFRVLDPMMKRVGGATPATEVMRRPEPGTPNFITRVALAFDVLLGRPARHATAPEPAPPGARPSPPGRMPASYPQAVQPSTRRRHEVFVSYATEDKAFVDQMVHALESRGRPCWIAHRDIPAGVPSWSEPIVTAIASSRLVLVILTEHSIVSVDVLREVTLADDEKIPMLPVNLDGTPMSPGLRYFFIAGQRLDLAGSTRADQVLSILPAVDGRLPATP